MDMVNFLVNQVEKQNKHAIKESILKFINKAKNQLIYTTGGFVSGSHWFEAIVIGNT